MLELIVDDLVDMITPERSLAISRRYSDSDSLLGVWKGDSFNLHPTKTGGELGCSGMVSCS
jgi:hypothetical protein